jgi:hypothetical protein
MLAELLWWVLFLFGIGFLIANLKIVVDLIRFRVRKASALLIWQGPKPRYYRFCIALGVVLGVLIAVKLFVLNRPKPQVFGEAMMCLYYAYAFPASTRIGRGFYKDGIWSDGGFMPYGHISALSWKDEGRVTLVIVSRLKLIARRLEVPGHVYGEARRLLRDLVKTHNIEIRGSGLDLGSRDDRDVV